MDAQHATVAHWNGGYDEAALQSWAEALRRRLPAPQVSLGLVFMSPRFFANAPAILELLRVHAQIPLLAGCSSTGLISGDEESEDDSGLVLGLYWFPGGRLHAFRFSQEEVEESSGPGYWHMETGINPDATNGWLAFADPFNMDCDRWLKQWNEAYAPLPILGGLATGDANEQRTQLYLDGEVFEEGGVAISFGGDVQLSSVISQGCTPIGDTWTITKVDQNIVHEIGNRPAYEVLLETIGKLSTEEQKKLRGNLFIGLVVNEYLEEFHRGDFLIRNVLGADPKSGALVVGALPRLGQTLQFQRRDAAAATEDMSALLHNTKRQLGSATIYGGCLCSCNGRGHRLFGLPHHDARMIQAQLGPLPLAGFFCNGEIGPVGDRNFLHGYTASLALFLKK